jgi:hypothetical protein
MKCRREIEKSCIDVETEVCETEEVCILNEDTVACHNVTILNYKEFSVYADVVVESIDRGVEYVKSGAPNDAATQILLNPARKGSPGVKTIRFKITKASDTDEREDRLRVTVRFYLRKDDPKNEKNATVPDTYPEIELV